MPPRLVVIDTQSLLDWLVFRNPACAGWEERLGNSWKWVFTTRMREEFDYVAARGFGPRWPVDLPRAASAWESMSHWLDCSPTPSTLRCTDPDDQMFIDLAIGAQAQALVTRDRALLRLARRADRLHGLRICPPLSW